MKFIVVDAFSRIPLDTITYKEAMHLYDRLPAKEKAVKRNEVINEMRK